MSHCKPVALRKLLEDLGQLTAWRDASPIEQYGDHRNAALQGGGNLDTHEVVGIIQATAPRLVANAEPVRSDHRQQHTAFRNLIAQNLREIHAEGYAVHVHKNEISSKL